MKINRNYIIIGLIGVLVGAGLIYLGIEVIAPKIQASQESDKPVQKSTSDSSDKNNFTKSRDSMKPKFNFTDLEVGPSEIKYEGLSNYITGTIKNNSKSVSLEYIEIEFDVYDSNGNLLGRISDVLFGLDMGQTWQYEAMIYYNNAENIKLNDIKWREANYY